jgi:glycosyltransferase involved in cell wall biosynthesis
MISVVIPVHNAAHTLGECLQALQRSDYAEREVIVVDDASTDTSAELAARYGCRVVRLPENVGAARAKNIGAREARGDIILFTDGDILLQPDTLRLVAEHLQDSTVSGVVGLLGQKLRYNNFSSQFKNLWMHYTYKRIAGSLAAERGVGLFFTSIASIRKDVFERLGGFDTNYEGASVTEDIEFGQRLLSAACKVHLDGRLTVEHLKHYSLAGLLKTDLERAFGLTKTWLRKKLGPRTPKRGYGVPTRRGMDAGGSRPRRAVACGERVPVACGERRSSGGTDAERLPHQEETGQKYYASVPWFFMVGVPLAWLLPVLVALALWMWQPLLAWGAALAYAAILLVNASFLSDLFRARGWWFGLQSCLFLPVDLWVSGLGALWAMIDYLRGNRY